MDGSIQLEREKLDLWAVALSGVCLVHCLALPIISTAIPLALQTPESHWVHVLLVLLATPLSAYVIWKSLEHSRAYWFVVVAASGLALLNVAAFVPVVSALEAPLTVAGAALLGSAHLARWIAGSAKTTVA